MVNNKRETETETETEQRERESQQGREVKLDDGCNLHNWFFFIIFFTSRWGEGWSQDSTSKGTNKARHIYYLYLSRLLFIYFRGR